MELIILKQGYMMKHLIIILVFASTFSHAQTTIDVSQVFGVEKAIQSQISQMRDGVNESVARVQAQALSQLPYINDRQREEVEKVTRIYVEKMAASMNAENLAAIWNDTFSQSLTEEEVLAVVGFYSSPVGQKVVRGMHEANNALQNEIMRVIRTDYERIANEYYAALKKAASCCTE